MSSAPACSSTVMPALSVELGKAEARQAKNLWVTTRAIDALHERIARAKRDIDNATSGSGDNATKQPPSSSLAPSPQTPSPITSPKMSSRSPSSSRRSPSAKSPSLKSSPSKSPSSLKSPSSSTKSPSTPRARMDAREMELEEEDGAIGMGCVSAGTTPLAELAADVERMKTLDAVGSEHKNFHATISKLAKAAEKTFGGEVESVRRLPPLSPKALHNAISTHLYRRGAFRAAARFAEDSLASIPTDTSAQLVEMHGVLDAFSKQNLVPAERWFEKRRMALEEMGSSLEFQLVRLRFLCFLKGADPQQRREAVLFARERLAPLTPAHMREIQELMGSVLWAGRLEESPYSHLLSADLWSQVKEAVIVDGSRLSGLSRESVLAVAFRAGVLALPTLIKMAAVVRGSNQDWDGMHELPLEVPLPPGLRYHSMFSCPVSREPSTPGNPPVLLRCGHAVLRSSVSRLPRNGPKFKCPTCPQEQTEDDTMVLTL